MKDTFRMTRRAGTGLFNGQTGRNTQDSGRMASRMEKGNSFSLMDSGSLGNGKMAKELNGFKQVPLGPLMKAFFE